MSRDTDEHRHLLEQLTRIAHGLGQTFAPFCEVVVHDLRTPDNSVHAIENALSGREVGDGATEIGLARIADPAYPEIIANYANRFPDGRQAKSTSIGIKDSSGQFVAALCMNLDLTLFHSLQSAMGQFVQVEKVVGETLDGGPAARLRQHIDRFAARLSSTPRALKADERRSLLLELKEGGLLELRKAMEIVSQHLGVSRATAYSYLK